MPQLATDDYSTYANGGLGSSSGGIWTDLSSFSPISVVSNQLVGGSAEALAVRTTWAGSTSLQYSEIIWLAGQYGGPSILSNAFDTCYFLELTLAGSPNGQGGIIIRMPGYVAVGSFVGRTLISGHSFNLRMDTPGTLVGSDNGTDFITASDGTITTGKPGIRNYSMTMGAWAGGDFGGAPPAGTLWLWERTA